MKCDWRINQKRQRNKIILFINDFRFANNIYASIYAEHFIPSVGFRINHKSIRRVVQSIVIKNRSIQSA